MFPFLTRLLRTRQYLIPFYSASIQEHENRIISDFIHSNALVRFPKKRPETKFEHEKKNKQNGRIEHTSTDNERHHYGGESCDKLLLTKP